MSVFGFTRAFVVLTGLLTCLQANDHPSVATTLNNMAYVVKAQGDKARARQLWEQSLAIRRRSLGPDHPDTKSVVRALAAL